MSKRVSTILVVAAASVLAAAPALAAPGGQSSGSGASPASEVAAYWNAARRDAAIPRDLAVDERGQGHIRGANGTWLPYGGRVTEVDPVVTSATVEFVAKPAPMARPSGGSTDKTPPVVSGQDPAVNATIGTLYTFKAVVSDGAGSGVRSVSFVLTFPSGTTRSYATTKSGDTYSTSFSGFTAGAWAWRVVAKDNAGNTRTTPTTSFTVGTSGGGTGTDVADASWSGGGNVQNAAGRIFFSMPSNGTQWADYVCSGTAVTDTPNNTSIILTAAHCVYDDANGVFARNVLFIPNQAGTSVSGSDRTCTNDPLGCWTPSHGVVDIKYTQSKFPANSPWDYAFYVVPNDPSAHTGTAATSDALEIAVAPLSIQFSKPVSGQVAQAMGYSYSQDPRFRYCSQSLGMESAGDWWLSQCGLSGGASGGPWLQGSNPVTGNDPIISVNSWGYTTGPGMAGPPLWGNSAKCVFDSAQTLPDPVTSEGIKVTVPSPGAC